MKERTRTIIVLLLSLLPGASHLYLRRPKKALGLLFITAGILATFVFSRSYTARAISCFIYVFTFFPSAFEAYNISREGHPVVFDINSPWYIILLLLMTGFSAVPLLWQSNRFSLKAKIMWTAIVTILAALFFSALIVFGDLIEEKLSALFS